MDRVGYPFPEKLKITSQIFNNKLYRSRNLSEPELICLKGQSNYIYDLQFFSSFEPALAIDQWIKIFLILVRNSQSY